MAEYKSGGKVVFTINMNMSEEEARALLAITRYGTIEFLKFFYQSLGESNLREHEDGLISLFKSIESVIPSHLAQVDRAREAFINKGDKN